MQNSVPRDYTHTHTQQTTHTSILTIHHLIYSQLKQIPSRDLRRMEIYSTERKTWQVCFFNF